MSSANTVVETLSTGGKGIKIMLAKEFIGRGIFLN